MSKRKQMGLMIVIALFGIVCCMLAMVCYNELWIHDTTMPEIVFYYKSEYLMDCPPANKNEVVGFIDKNGKVYLTRDARIRRYDFDELYEKYVSGELDGKMELVGTFDVSELQNKYVMTKQVASNKAFELQSEASYSWIAPDEYWYGAYYDAHGEEQMVMLYRYGEQTYRCTDERAYEIYQWISGSLNNYHMNE